jgi:hypothetical protein
MKSAMTGIIESIKAYPAKGGPARELTEARLIDNRGLEGDFHATGGERQVSLLFAEIREKISAEKERGGNFFVVTGPAGTGGGLCFSRFRENITVRGMSPNALRPGLRLAAGEAVLEITGETKHCHEECSLYEAGKLCPLAGKSLFAKVLKGGVIRVGDGAASGE